MEVLSDHPLFRDLPGKSLSAVLGEAQVVAFEVGSLLWERGQPASHLLLLIEGEVRLEPHSGSPGATQGPGQLVGQEAAGLAHYGSTARALTPVRAWRIPAGALHRLCAQVPGLEAQLAYSCALNPSEGLASGSQAFAQRVTNPGASASPPANRVLVGWFTTLTVPLLLFAMTSAWGMPAQSSTFIAVGAMMTIMWVFALVDDYIPPLLALVALTVVGLAPTSVVLSSFASPSFVILVSVLALAAMQVETGLSNRVLLWLLLKMPHRGVWLQMIMMVYGAVLSISTPSANSRMTLLVPAFRDMSRGLNLLPGSLGITALFAGSYAGAILFSSTFATSKSTSITITGFLPLHLQTQFSGLFWLSAAALSTVLLVVIHSLSVRWQLRAKASELVIDRQQLAQRLRLLGPMSAAEIVTALSLAYFLVGMMTISWHHISPTGIAGTALVCLLVSGVMTKTNFQKGIDWPLIIFLISIDCLIRVMDYVGLSSQLAQVLVGASAFVQGELVNFLVLALVLISAIRLFLPIPAAHLLSAVVLLPIAQAQGISLWICIFATAMFSDIWFFRYQNTLMGIAAHAGIWREINSGAFMRHNMVMNAARIGCVFASIPWWHWMGIA